MSRSDAAVPAGTMAAALLAVDPRGLGGAAVRGGGTRSADAWLATFAALLPAGAPVRRIPSTITDDRLLGGLDLASTLATGHAVAERGVLAEADGGAVVLRAATARPQTWSHVARALDTGEVRVERDGLAARHATAFAALALDDGDEPCIPAGFLDRAAFLVDLALDDAPEDARAAAVLDARAVADARRRLPDVRCADGDVIALCEGAHALGVDSPRVLLRAVAAARASAALAGRLVVDATDVARAARLVLAPRACPMPEGAPGERDAPSDAADERPAPNASSSDGGTDDRTDAAGEMADVVVRAAHAALPPGLLGAAAVRLLRAASGRAGAEQSSTTRGRQVGTRRGDPRSGARLDLVATLRAAAPFQRVRAGQTPPLIEPQRTQRTQRKNNDWPSSVSSVSSASSVVKRSSPSHAPLVRLRRDDFRVRRCVTPAQTTTVFVVDASGSAALHRLAEAKGAVELLLAEGYARRERVALVAFRGTDAALVLPPTHALARARRAIAGLAAGGGTPLASALDRATLVARGARRDGAQVVVVLLTDGRANVARDGRGGRARAESDALAAAALLRAAADGVVLVDTAPRPEPFAARVAHALGARYVPLPRADAHGIATLAQASHASGGSGG